MKLLKIITPYCLLLTAYCGSAFAAPSFSDLSPSHTHYEGIQYLVEEGILSGYGDGTIGIDRPVMRGEMAKVLMLLTQDSQSIESCQETPFADVPADAWFTPFVCLAHQLGIIKGYDPETFGPGRTINFVEAAKMITISLQTDLSSSEGEWYMTFVTALSQHRAIPLSVQRYDQPISRGEMAEMIYRLRENVTQKPSRDPFLQALSPSSLYPQIQSQPLYLPFSTELYEHSLGNKTIGLLFHADWCPLCQKTDQILSQHLPDLPPNTIILKVDYDTEDRLKSQYKIFYQNTLVILDREGKAVKRLSPTSWTDLEGAFSGN